MRTEIQEVLQSKLESFVTEHLNEVAKTADGDCHGINMPNAELRYYKGYIDGMCCALNFKGWGLESGYWVIRDAHNRIVASCKDAWDDEDE